MSDRNLARRASAEIIFDGINISESISRYLLSMTYIDSEEDEADDLQIKLQDREGLWLESWLGKMIDAASSAPVNDQEPEATSGIYRVTPKIGLNVREGPSTNYARYGALAYGTTVEVESIANGWARTQYDGKTAYVCADYLERVSTDTDQGEETTPSTALKIQAVIAAKNWNGDGKDQVLDCGQFELDSIDASGPPSEVTIKATALPYTSTIRQTLKSRAWESYSLSGIAEEIAKTNGMTCMYLADTDPHYSRIEQFQTPDINFLSARCKAAGISLKASNNILVLFDQASYEAKRTVLTIRKGDKTYTKYKVGTGKKDHEFSSCRVRWTTASGQLLEGIAKVSDFKEDANTNQQLEIRHAVSGNGEAKALAEKMLRMHNKYQKTASFTMPGNPALVSGLTVQLVGWGTWSGKYIIMEARHTLSSSYTTQIKLRNTLEGY